MAQDSTTSSRNAAGEDRRVGAFPRHLWLDGVLLLAVVGVAGILCFHRLGASSLMGDEAIYADVAQKAAVQGHWVPLYVRGGVFTSKPPLAIWATALAFRWRGVGESAARAVSAGSGVAVASLVFLFGRWLHGRWTATLAALLLATSRPWLFEHGVRDGVGDGVLTLLCTAALLLYLTSRPRPAHAAGTTRRRLRLAAAAVMVGLAALVKGLVGPFLLLAVTLSWELAFAWLARRRRWERPAQEGVAPRLAEPFALAAAGLVCYLPWVGVNLMSSPHYLSDLYVDTVVRVTASVAPSHIHGPGFYPQVLALGFGAWLVFALLAPFARPAASPAAAPDRADTRPYAALLLILWAGVVVAMLSLSVSKLTWYAYPAFPALALLLAAGAAGAWQLARGRAWRALVAAAVAVGLGLRAHAAWAIVESPPRRTTMHRFVLAYRALPAPRLFIDALDTSTPARLREWNYFYLDTIPAPRQGLPTDADRGRCNLVVTNHPREVAARPGLAGGQVIQVQRVTLTEADLFIVDLCAGAVARQLR